MKSSPNRVFQQTHMILDRLSESRSPISCPIGTRSGLNPQVLPGAGSELEDLGPEAILPGFINFAGDPDCTISDRCEVGVIEHARPRTCVVRFVFPSFLSRFFKNARNNALSRVDMESTTKCLNSRIPRDGPQLSPQPPRDISAIVAGDNAGYELLQNISSAFPLRVVERFRDACCLLKKFLASSFSSSRFFFMYCL